MQRMKAVAFLSAMAIALAACSGGNNGASGASGGNVTLTIAAVKGVEDTGLKALAPMYTQKTGVKIKIVEAPYADLYTKLVNTFQAHQATYDLVMMDDPWMPKFGTIDALTPLEPLGVQKDTDVAQVVWDVGTWPPLAHVLAAKPAGIEVRRQGRAPTSTQRHSGSP